jgi:hypothetical protein
MLTTVFITQFGYFRSERDQKKGKKRKKKKTEKENEKETILIISIPSGKKWSVRNT